MSLLKFFVNTAVLLTTLSIATHSFANDQKPSCSELTSTATSGKKTDQIDRSIWLDNALQTTKRSERAELIQKRNKELGTVSLRGALGYRSFGDMPREYQLPSWSDVTSRYDRARSGYSTDIYEHDLERLIKEGPSKWSQTKAKYMEQISTYQSLTRKHAELGGNFAGFLEIIAGPELNKNSSALSQHDPDNLAATVFIAELTNRYVLDQNISNVERLDMTTKLINALHRPWWRQTDFTKILKFTMNRIPEHPDLFFAAIPVLDRLDAVYRYNVPYDFVRFGSEKANEDVRDLESYGSIISMAIEQFNMSEIDVVTRIWTDLKMTSRFSAFLFRKYIRTQLSNASMDARALELWLLPWIANPNSELSKSIMSDLEWRFRKNKQLLDEPAIDTMASKYPQFDAWLNALIAKGF